MSKIRILIDDCITNDGCKGETYIEYPADIPKLDNTEKLILELQFASIKGVSGYRLVEEKVLLNGDRQVIQEYFFAPDTAYALFKHWKELDDDM